MSDTKKELIRHLRYLLFFLFSQSPLRETPPHTHTSKPPRLLINQMSLLNYGQLLTAKLIIMIVLFFFSVLTRINPKLTGGGFMNYIVSVYDGDGEISLFGSTTVPRCSECPAVTVSSN